MKPNIIQRQLYISLQPNAQIRLVIVLYNKYNKYNMYNKYKYKSNL